MTTQELQERIDADPYIKELREKKNRCLITMDEFIEKFEKTVHEMAKEVQRGHVSRF